MVNLFEIVIAVVSLTSLGLSIYAVRYAKHITTATLKVAPIVVSGSGVACAKCNSHVARFTLTPKGPVCANCHPIS